MMFCCVSGQRVVWCVEVEQHMRTIVENKDLLVYHLQQPLVSTFLTMHHRYHRSLLLPLILLSLLTLISVKETAQGHIYKI